MDSLSPSQQASVQHFQSIINEPNTAACISLLAAHAWQLEDAVAFALQVPDFAQHGGDGSNSNSSSNSGGARETVQTQQTRRVPAPMAVPSSSSYSSSSSSFMSRPSPSPLRSPSPGPAASSDGKADDNNNNASPSSRLAFLNRIPGAGLVKGTFNLVKNFTGSVLPFWQPTPAQREGGEATQEEIFLTQFQEQNPNGPDWFRGSYAEAVKAGRACGRMIFIYLHCASSPDTGRFVSETLSDESVRNFLNENFVCWIGNLQHSDAYKLSHTLAAHEFPFIALLAKSSQPRQVMVRLKRGGFIDGDHLIAELLQKMEIQKEEEEKAERLHALHQHASIAAQANRAASASSSSSSSSFYSQSQSHSQSPPSAAAVDPTLLANRNLRAAQDAEYREALAADQEEKKKAQRLAEERRAREEQERREEEDKKRKYEEILSARQSRASARADYRSLLAASPEPAMGPGVSVVSVRLPNSRKVQRRFMETAPMKDVFQWLGAQEMAEPVRRPLAGDDDEKFEMVNPQDEASFTYRVVSTHPKQIHSDPSVTIKSLGLGKQILLLVERIDEGDAQDNGNTSMNSSMEE